MTTVATERSREVAMATAYVRSRFYPPLPHVYGELAVDARDAYREDPDAILTLPHDLPVLPKQAEPVTEEVSGPEGWELTLTGWTISAAEFLCALRLDHLLADEDEDEEV